MKITPTVNSFLWGLLGLLALAGVPITLMNPGELGLIPVFGSVLAAMMLFNLAYRQWKKKVIEVDFFEVAPYMAIGVTIVIVFSLLSKIET
ncbi:hypothetical protein GWQ43_19860 (plasmid) [Alcaligenes faecalis]|uniref:hypothetical protein n=1 Tax=Alcaligenes faecalis TaxID=511 RepID=UPI000F67FC98|nr:hypothetical protein [Alcaligenes faecalis]QHS38425.1 hypothetical protein GWQ43_19860 [Alcaligenes faecalis]RSE57613.1 hypothetical protein EGT81_19450 [Alcaligenes faecalis]